MWAVLNFIAISSREKQILRNRYEFNHINFPCFLPDIQMQQIQKFYFKQIIGMESKAITIMNISGTLEAFRRGLLSHLIYHTLVFGVDPHNHH